MWNSPSRKTAAGKRYSLDEIAVLILPLPILIDSLNEAAVTECTADRIFQSFEKNEFLWALAEVFRALLGEKPVPKDGHPGYQEALILELLNQTYSLIEMELDGGLESVDARRVTWRAYTKFCLPVGSDGLITEYVELEGLARKGSNQKLLYLSPKVTASKWKAMLLDEFGLWREFLWDTDWQLNYLMDSPEKETETITQSAGIDLKKVHELPHSPTAAELTAAKKYLHALCDYQWNYDA